MESIGEIIPFAKEMLNHGPSRGLVKMYMLGTTMAFIGVVGVLVETVCLPFSEQEEPILEGVTKVLEEEEEEEKQTLTAPVEREAVKILETTEIWVKAKPVTAGQRNTAANRSHAS